MLDSFFEAVFWTNRVIKAGRAPKKLPNVAIIATGGTIAGEAATSTQSNYAAGQVSVETLIKAVPKSSCVDGIAITHATDTLEETAYFLHLTVKTRRPVVLDRVDASFDRLKRGWPSEHLQCRGDRRGSRP